MVRPENREKKQIAIEDAAYSLIETKGYAGMSMLAVAKSAKASNETLYRWYGDKIGLFKAMVVRNAAEVKQLLDAAIEGEADPMRTLQKLGPTLLQLLTGDRAIALNRAAAADATGELGKALAAAGRQTIAPLIAKTLEHCQQKGLCTTMEPAEAADLYIRLLIGDMQIRRVTGAMPAPTKTQINERAQSAIEMFIKLTSSATRSTH